jgi:hypothetical protein
MQPATLQLAQIPAHPNSTRLPIDCKLSDQTAEILAKENRLSGPSDANGLDPVLEQIKADTILALYIVEAQIN